MGGGSRTEHGDRLPVALHHKPLTVVPDSLQHSRQGTGKILYANLRIHMATIAPPAGQHKTAAALLCALSTLLRERLSASTF